MSIDTPADDILGLNSVHCTTFVDCMIRKFLRDGKLRMKLDIVPIKDKNVTPKMNVISQNNVGSQLQNSGKIFNHLP